MRVSTNPQESSSEAPREPEGIDFARLAIVFIFYGVLGFLTAAFLGTGQTSLFDAQLSPMAKVADDPIEPGEQVATRDYAVIGPFQVQQAGTVIKASFASNLPLNSWSFVEAELLDQDRDYLFSFGKELWHETGVDSDGKWTESDISYEMKFTVAEPGTYFLNIKTQGSAMPGRIRVMLATTIGSSIPHFAFGIITLVIGLIMNEVVNRTILRLLDRFSR